MIGYIGMDNFTENGTVVDEKSFVGHGLVLCLKNVTADDGIKWSDELALVFTEAEKVFDVDGLKRTTNVSGYNHTKTLATIDNAVSKFPAAYKAYHYGENDGELVAPTSTTGWFMPSAQQWVKIVENLGGLSENDILFGESLDTDQTGIKSLENMIKKAGTDNYDSMLTQTQLLYWSSSEHNENFAICLLINGNPAYHWGFEFQGKMKDVHLGYTTVYHVRPSLAF